MRIRVLASGAKGNCYSVSDGETSLLLECGIHQKQITAELCQMGVPGIDACLVSHEHNDHSKAVKDLIELGVPCYMSYATAEALGVAGKPGITELGPGGWLPIGSWLVVPFPDIPDAKGPFGFVLHSGEETLLYASGMVCMPPVITGITHLMMDYSMKEEVYVGDTDRQPKHRVMWNHQSLEAVLKYVRKIDRSKLQELYLLHLSDNNSDKVEFQKAVGAATGARVHVT